MKHVLLRERTDDGFVTIDVDAAGYCTRTRLSSSGEVLEETLGNIDVAMGTSLVERIRAIVFDHPEARGEARAVVGFGDENGPQKLVAVVGSLSTLDAGAVSDIRRLNHDVEWRAPAPEHVPVPPAGKPPWWYWFIPGLQGAAILGTLGAAAVAREYSRHASWISMWLIGLPLVALSGVLALIYFIDLLTSERHLEDGFSRTEAVLPAFALCIGAPALVVGLFIAFGR